jgi:hypothetical protein
MGRAALILLVAAVLAGCGSDDNDDGLRCDELTGKPTQQVIETLDNEGCIDSDGEPLVSGNTFVECDGRTLYANDLGWGYDDGPWQDTPPPTC